ncbi:FXSXX-COOH protein [Streptomyces sp. NBC_01390]|uniref:FXSXX-COOH protein n=1 Tax=Streptomyces sp. NBC_01390 TaxID=2903850 RepID=UPI00324AEA6D
MNASFDTAAEEPGKTAGVVGPERVPLVTLARARAESPALTRAVSNGGVQRGPSRVTAGAFQSSV